MSKSESPAAPSAPRKRGFAALSPERVKEIASKGGKAAHAAGTGHQWDANGAREAGKKGGSAPHVRRGTGPRKTPSPAPQDGQEALPEVE